MSTRQYILSSFLLCLIALFYSSCKTYIIPVDSFKQQFSSLDTTLRNEKKVIGPLGGTSRYKTYPVDFIKAVDNNGNTVNLKVSPSIEIRFTYSGNRKTIFYFDLMQVHGDSVMGRQSRIIKSIKKTILLSSVKKIEVQDGRKNYHYAEQNP